MYWVGQKVCSGFPDHLTEKNPSELLGQLNMRSCDGGENVLGYFIAKLTRAEAFETKREKKRVYCMNFCILSGGAKSSFKAQVQ